MSDPDVPRRFDLMGIGKAFTDGIVSVDFSTLHKLDVPLGSSRALKPQELSNIQAQLPQITWMPGGPVANSTASFSVLGGRSTFFGQVGSDKAGVIFTAGFTACGVDTSFIQRVEGKPTGCCLVLITPDKQRSILYTDGVAADFPLFDPERPYGLNANILFLDYCFNYTPFSPILNEILRLNPTAKIVTTLQSLSESKRDLFCADAIRNADIVFGNREEFGALRKILNQPLSSSLAQKHGSMFVETLDKDGVAIHTASRILRINIDNPLSPEQIIDSTGAGDGFAAGFLKKFVDGAPLDACAKAGHVMAGRILQTRGGRILN